VSIASDFRSKWSALIRSADETRGQNDDARFAAAARAADEVGCLLIPKTVVQTLSDRIKELEANCQQ
jgi:aspartokinase-like uncharacterized kinase